ncbi:MULTISPECIES: ParB/RepB/Spo0J family partition protein [Pseudomonas syringae group]|uniref:ParB/RepB/Spo0J family partition protein n=1 Tax=Pseudomonas syringae group TaxID=136849 RepID=UPI000EFF1025|nr:MULTISPECIES: ParB N-terminal domain-containing protein [Pseudomonas syringae group]MDH4602514.1 ParB N-terminal domain-containing protein [Pseudomonas syringae pv. papulans]
MARRELASALDVHAEIAAGHLASISGEAEGRLYPRFPLLDVIPSPDNPRRKELDRAGVSAEFIKRLQLKEGEPISQWLERLDEHLYSFDKEKDPKSYRVLEELFELALTIKTDGLFQPIVITPQNVIVMGERRWVASLLANILFNSVIVKEYSLSLVDKARLLENTKRSNLSTASIVRAVRRIVESELNAPCGPGNADLNEPMIRQVFSLKHTTAARYVAFCKLHDGDPVLEAIYADQMTSIRAAYEAVTERLRELKNQAGSKDLEQLEDSPPSKKPGNKSSNKYPPVKTRLPGSVGGQTLFRVMADHPELPAEMVAEFKNAAEAWPKANDVQRKEIFSRTMNAFFALSDPEEGEDK